MDKDTRQSLGLALIGAVAVVFGALVRLADSDATNVIAGIALWAGGVFAVIGVLRIALGLLRPQAD